MERGVLGLGIESSCDETSAAVIQDGREVLSLFINSQIELHQPYAGVVPELASRNHLVKVNEVIDRTLEQAGLKLKDLDYIAVTKLPGLMGSLLVGVQTAKTLSLVTGHPLVGINHLAAHIHAPFLHYKDYQGPPFPREKNFLSLLISGGHSALIEYRADHSLHLWATTMDDAAGEAFDKTAKLLGLGYPGGPIIEKLARQSSFASKTLEANESNRNTAQRPLEELPIPPILKDAFHQDLRFSFSGIKTSVVRLSQPISDRFPQKGEQPVWQDKRFVEPILTKDGLRYSLADLAYALQYRITELLARNVARALEAFLQRNNYNQGQTPPPFVLSGGVAANGFIRERLRQVVEQKGLELAVPPPILCTDNAAMVAANGYYLWSQGQSEGLAMEVSSRASWDSVRGQ